MMRVKTQRTLLSWLELSSSTMNGVGKPKLSSSKTTKKQYMLKPLKKVNQIALRQIFRVGVSKVDLMFRGSRVPLEIAFCLTCLRSIKVNSKSQLRLCCLRKVRSCLSLNRFRCLLKGRLYLQLIEKEKINRIN